MKKAINIIVSMCLLFLILQPATDIAQGAGLLDMGQPCPPNTDAQCVSNSCEKSNIKFGESNLYFCACDDDEDCASMPGLDETYECKSGSDDDITHNIHYCQKDTEAPKYFITPQTIAQAKVESATRAESGITSDTVTGIVETAKLEKTTITPPKMNFPLPGLPKWQPQSVAPGETAKTTYIVDYVIALYSYGLTLLIIAAVIALLIGGILYLSAGMMPDNIATAKKLIVGAFSGLLLVLSSYLMLGLINPELISFRPMEIETIKTEELDFNTSTTTDHNPTAGESFPGVIPSVSASACTTKPSVKADNPFQVNTDYLGAIDCLTKYERKLEDITYVVLHEGGKPPGIINWWLRDPKATGYASTHYVIALNGDIYQFMDESKVAWHSGKFDIPSIGIDLDGTISSADFPIFCPAGLPKCKPCINKCKDGNWDCRAMCKKYGFNDITDCDDLKKATIEVCGMTRPKAQTDALKKLLESISSRTNVKIDNSSIISHCAIAAPTKRTDPRNLDWTELGLETDAAYMAGHSGSQNCQFYPKFYDNVKAAVEKLFK
jgi:hypothetical protein